MMSDSYQTVIEAGTSDCQWDDFLSGIEYGHHEQSTYWAKVKELQRWHAVRIKVLKDSNIIAGAQMLCKQFPMNMTVGYISSGPFYINSDSHALEILVSSINQWARKNRIHYVAITPYIEDYILDEILVKSGFSLTQELLPPTATTRATLILDLSMDLDSLLMDMRCETRREIKLSSKSGFIVREGLREDLDTLFRLMSITATRRGEWPVPGSADFFKAIWDYFYSSGLVKLFLVELGDDIISAGFIFTFGNTVRFWKYGWSGKLNKKHPNQMLYWELIKWAKNNNFRYFDIVQVDPFVTDHLSVGLPLNEDLKSRRLYGPTFFKTGFGGKVLKFSGPWFRFQNPVMAYLYKYFGRPLLRTPYVKKLVPRI